MGRILLGAGLTGVFLFVQGVMILYTGNLRGLGVYFGKPPEPGHGPPVAIRLFSAGFFIASGGGVLCIIVSAGLRSGLTMTSAWHHVWAVCPNVLIALVLLGGGLHALFRPSSMLRTARSAYPDIPEDYPFGFMIVRLIAAGWCLMGLFILFALVS